MSRPRIQIVYANSNKDSEPKKEDSGIRVINFDRPKINSEIKYGMNKKNKVPKSYADLLSELKGTGELWEDPDFLPETKSVYPSKSYRRFDWKRPGELVSKPKLFEGGTSRFDIKQGELGDCWVLAALASLCTYPTLLKRVVPDDQDFEDNYIGAFRFYFWKFGEWKEVIVDDRLPTNGGNLIFMHSDSQKEFWSALFEKAYAKFNSSYEALSGGSQAEAMVDFTGGLCETIDLENKPPSTLFQQMLRNMSKQSLMGCSIDPGEAGGTETDAGMGLLAGHAYSITDVKKFTLVSTGRTEHQLVRVRNPWGTHHEWTGDWSDKSDEWNNISQSEREELGLVFADDGEFWMCYSDFVKHFTKLECCHLSPENFNEDDDKGHWEMTVEAGQWQKNVNAGGCRNFLASFWTNPQYHIEVVDPDDQDSDVSGQVLIGLMQKDMRLKRQDFLTIGYSIYKLKDPDSQRLNLVFFKLNRTVARSDFTNAREVTGYHKLNPGHYVIVPSTFRPNEEAAFQLRIFCEKAPKSCEMDSCNASADVNPELFDELETHAMHMSFPGEDNADLLPNDDTEHVAEHLRELRDKFYEFSGPSEVIQCHQLQEIFNAAVTMHDSGFEGFDLEAARSMIALMDENQSGKMEYKEFIDLWKLIRIWTAIFKEHDANKSGDFDAYELRMALKMAGYELSNKVFAAVANRYASPITGTVTFGEFIVCLVRLKNAFKHFNSQSKNSKGEAIFDETTYLCQGMYV